MNTVFRKKSNMWVRPNTSDDLVIDEAPDYLSLFSDIKDEDIFIDIGSNIGAVSSLVNKLFPKIKIICYEPDRENYEMTIINTNEMTIINTNENILDRILVFNKAVGSHNEPIYLFPSKGTNKGKHSTFLRKGNSEKRKIKVEQVEFNEAIKKYKATLIKCDIEGAEYNINFQNISHLVKGLAIEIHKIHNNWEKMKKLYIILSNQFSYELGDIPKDDNWYKERDCFMIIFLRNT